MKKFTYLEEGGLELLFTLLIGVEHLIDGSSEFDDMTPFVSEELSMVSVNTLLCPDEIIFCEEEEEGSNGNKGFSSSFSELVKLFS